jgi:allophanate hydrolase subunit 1
LDNTAFAKREAAHKGLLELGIAAEPALRARLKNNPSLESQRRLEAILKTIVEAPQPLTAESLRGIRAVAVLARINSPSARAILEKLAAGVESARLTRAANAALGR